MRRLAFFLTFALATPMSAQGRPADTVSPALRDSVIAPIKALFNGMRTRDTALMRSAFAPGAMLSEPSRPGEPLKFGAVDAMLGSVASAPAGPAWDEQIYDAEVRVDANLAMVWTFYTFTAGDYSHCGVDAVLLVRTPRGWKISTLSDSRRRTGCEVAGRTKA